MKNDDVSTTILTQIADALEEHNKILAAHRKHLKRLSEEVAGLKKKVQDLESADLVDSSDVKFIQDVSARLKAISNTLDTKP